MNRFRMTEARTWLLLVSAVQTLISFEASAFPMRSPEQDALETSRFLRPIPDERWGEIAGERASQDYAIVTGDTLYDVSKRLFGDASLWPKVWALNNRSITNPHLVCPGKSVVFMPGSGSSLPEVAIQNTSEIRSSAGEAILDINYASGPTKASLIMTDGATTGTAVAPKAINKMDVSDNYAMLFDPEARAKAEAAVHNVRSSNEWQHLPRQTWEKTSSVLPLDIDAQGFDRRSRINNTRRANGFDSELIAATEEYQPLGTIDFARTPNTMLVMGDSVYVRSDGELQVGETYAVTDKPTSVRSSDAGRRGYAYQVLGRVKISGVKEGLYIASIVSSQYTARRGSFLIAQPPRIRNMRPIAAAGTVGGHILLDRRSATFATAQYKYVFVDRGTEDGVEPGMVFRVYQRKDPENDSLISETDFIRDGDVQIIQTSERFSLGNVIASISTIEEGRDATLLTDVSDLVRKRASFVNPFGKSNLRESDLDTLDQMDASGDLGKEEENELQQLETYGEPAEEAPAEGEELETIEVPGTAGAADGTVPGEGVDDGAAEVAPEPPAEELAPESAEIPPEMPAEAALETEAPAAEDDLDAAFAAPGAEAGVPPVKAGVPPVKAGGVDEPTPTAETATEGTPVSPRDELDTQLDDLEPPPVENAATPEPIPTPTPDAAASSPGQTPNDLDQLLESP